MTIKDELEKKGYSVDQIYNLAEELVDSMLEKQPIPEGLEPRRYMVMAAAATASSILSQIDCDRLKNG